MRVKNEPLPESNRLRTPRESMQAQSRRNAAINQLSKDVRHRRQTMRRSPRGNISLTCFVVKSVQDDYLTCRKISWTNGGPSFTESTIDTFIAKPWHLRRTSYDGLNVDGRKYQYTTGTARTVIINEGETNEKSESQIIIPIYQSEDGSFAGDVIFAVSISTGTGVKDSNGKVINWQDINLDGRAWAKVQS